MSLDTLVNVNVSLTAPGVTRAGFGKGLLVSYSADWVERVRTYTSAPGVLADFSSTAVEYLAALKYFGAATKPKELQIGRGALAPTVVKTLSVKSAVNSTDYVVHVFSGGVKQTATYTSDSSATNDEIATGLASAINALAAPAPNFTAAATGSGGSKVVTCTGAAAGDWFALECANRALLACVDSTSNPGIATDLAAIVNEDDSWYELLTVYNGAAMVAAGAAWVETAGKLYNVASDDTAIATHALSGATDLAAALKGSAYARTALFFHPRAEEFADVAKCSYFLPIDPGKDNWRLKTYKGVTPAVYTPTEIVNLKAKRAGFYYTLAGTSTDGGDGMTASGEFIDTTRGIDWWKIRLQEDGANLLMQSNKVPATAAGYELIANVIRARNAIGVTQGVIAPSPKPTVTMPEVGSADFDPDTRALTGIQTVWKYASAINSITVNATVTQ